MDNSQFANSVWLHASCRLVDDDYASGEAAVHCMQGRRGREGKGRQHRAVYRAVESSTGLL